MSGELLPVLKWAGGKRKLASMICNIIDLEDNNQYFEPFVGGAAVLLHLMPRQALCCDVNNELIIFYNVVKNKIDDLIKELNDNYSIDYNNSEFYYKIRKMDRDDSFYKMPTVKRAARFLYLNKTCFNGLWRVNKKGQNNVPFGKYKNPIIYKEVELRNLSKYLRENNIIFECCDYTKIENKVKFGDVVYFDPPYDVEEGQSKFVDYTLQGFGRNDQVKLKELCDRLVKKGAKVIISNSKTHFILNLYNDPNYDVYTINDSIKVNRLIGSKASSRGKKTEVLIIGKDHTIEKNNISSSK